LKFRLALITGCLWLTLVGPLPDAGAEGRPLQDALMLGQAFSAASRPDGLLTLGLGVRSLTTVYHIGDQLYRVGGKDLVLQGEWDPFSFLAVGAELPWRTWSGGSGWLDASGGGLGDGQWRAVVNHGFWGGRINLAAAGGGNIPSGSFDNGLGQGVFSPRATLGTTLRVWRQSRLPEMRLHLNWGQVWNQAEDTGYGVDASGLQPWPSRYPSSALAGHRGNDQTFGAVALEFRQAAASLWLEYARERFLDNAAIGDREQLDALSAGMRWGLQEGWALHGTYMVGIYQDDPATDWYPVYPEWSMTVAVTRQFGLGGRDRDGDGIPDRRDGCPDQPEDLDGFQDEDGCPDLDNDRDGVPDEFDQAPLVPEDLDGFQDEDGIPDYDNDGDGIADKDDLCPDVPENFNGRYDKDGCPDSFEDADQDGVEDRDDRCPDQAEDRDGFEDDDGCPDLDNDLDGIPDTEDACPDEAENYNGVDDGDGCPD